MVTALAFLVAIGVLVVVHEWGHFAMARACGVRVLRFSVGFGPKLWGWTSPRSGTEFIVSALPLGGFIKMLDETEGQVTADLRPMAFNNQPLRCRALIVLAGPLANLILAVLLYAAVNWTGVEQPEPLIARPPAGTILASAGLTGGERILQVTVDGGAPQDVASFEDFRWILTRAALERQDLRIGYIEPSGSVQRTARLALSDLAQGGGPDETLLMQRLGLTTPLSVAQMGDLVAGGAAQSAGLQRGDLVLQVDGATIFDAAQLRAIIRASVSGGLATSQHWSVRRGGVLHSFTVSPQPVVENGATIGRVGAYIGAAPSTVLVRYGLWDGLDRALVRTWEVSLLTVRMIGRMLVGEASLKNLSGPLSIADYAGKSAAMGVTSYLIFLALISISLGVLNLLPLPVLDGGHLLYYLWEAVCGKPVSEYWMNAMQRLGMATLLVMMSVAVFNDVARLVG